MQQVIKTIQITLLSILITGCAHVVLPSGGEKDSSPPVVVSASPQDLSVNFTGDEIEIKFDEYVKLQNLNENLIISPPLNAKPDIYLKKYSLIIHFKSPLLPNTTYTMNFGDAIADNTEGNIIPNFSYTFSTGLFIDSMQVQGKVVDVLTDEPAKGVFVMLYKNNSDTLPFTTKPDYITITDNEGVYTLNHLPHHQYKIFALVDGDRNFLYNLPDEAIAFGKDFMIDSISNIALSLFTEEPKAKVLEVLKENHGLAIVLNLPALYATTTSNSYINQTYNGDTLRCIFRFLNDTDVVVAVNYKSIPVDTISARLETSILPSWHINSGVLYKRDSIFLYFTGKNAIHAITYDSLMIGDDIDTAMRFVEHTDTVFFNAREGTTFHVFIPQGWMKDYSGVENLTDTLTITTKKENYFGSIHFKLKTISENSIFELLASDGKVISHRSINKPCEFTFYHLIPGNYISRIFIDNNKNGYWDTGNYTEQIQPEIMNYIDKKITVRSNWDFDIEW